MQKRKVVYFTDPLNDDFASSRDKIDVQSLPDTYCYRKPGFLWRFSAKALYYGVAVPVAVLLCRGLFGLRIHNKKALRDIKGGYFLYGNHTNGLTDAFTPGLVAFPRKDHVIAGPAVVCVPVARHFVPLLGGLPLPSDLAGGKKLLTELKTLMAEGRAVTVYPEAHIWPWYNGIRPFSAASFTYPVKLNVPAVAITVTYRQRRLFKRLPPAMDVTVSGPFYPDPTAPAAAEKQRLRDEVYGAMCRTVKARGSFAYVEYRPAPEAKTL